MFNYLIDHKARVVFFNDELQEGTIALLEQIMPQYLGEERYKLLKAKGQFKIFSEKDSTSISYIDKYEQIFLLIRVPPSSNTYIILRKSA